MADRGSTRPARLGTEEPSPVWRLLEALALAILAGVVIARGIMLETLRDAQPVVPGQVPPPAGPGATTSLVLSLIACLPALLVLLRRALDPGCRLARSWSHVIALILAGWALLSTFWAADRFAAVISATSFLAAVAVIWSTAQVVRDWSRLRLVVGIGLGLLMVYVAHGILYRAVDLPSLVRMWEQDIDNFRTNTFRERGWREDDLAAQRFDQKIRAGEMIGFTASANTFAALIITLGVLTGGYCIQRGRWREWGSLAVPVIVLGLAAWLLTYTQSKTAIATPVVATGLFLIVGLLGQRISPHRKLVYSLGVIGFFLASLAVIGHGLYHDSLVIDSLTFRWRYWVASAGLFVDHPLLGVGYANFGDYYLQYRLPVAAEEIRDPHNLFIRFFTELGLVGGVLALLWIAALWWTMTRPLQPAAPDGDAEPESPSTGDEGSGFGSAVAAGVVAAIIGFIFNMAAGIDFTQDGSWVFSEIAKRCIGLGLLVLGVILVMMRVRDGQVEADHRPAPWLLYGTLIACAIFLLHSLIDFAFFENGPMFLFALLAGAGLGMRSPRAGEVRFDARNERAARKERRVAALYARRPLPRGVVVAVLCGASVLWVVAWIGLFGPVLLAEDHANAGDALLRANQPARAAQRYEAAFDLLPFNGDYAFRAAQALAYTNANPGAVRRLLDQAIAANPRAPLYHLQRARYWAQARPGDWAPVLADFERAVELNPQELEVRIEYARLLADAGRISDALAQVQAALAINDAYHPDEPERLTSSRLQALEEWMAELRSGL